MHPEIPYGLCRLKIYPLNGCLGSLRYNKQEDILFSVVSPWGFLDIVYPYCQIQRSAPLFIHIWKKICIIRIMPRKTRIDACRRYTAWLWPTSPGGALHHIIVRGIERGIIFKDDINTYSIIQLKFISYRS
jgi:hypothetical protein